MNYGYGSTQHSQQNTGYGSTSQNMYGSQTNSYGAMQVIRTTAMEPMAVLMETIQNRKRKRKRENRADLENSLLNVQHLHLCLDW